VFTFYEAGAIWRAVRKDGMYHVLAPHKQQIVDAVSADTYQAIVPVPYFSTGSENIDAVAYFFTDYLSTYPSLLSGIPNAGLFLSRSSYSQSMQGLEMLGDYWHVPGSLTTEAGDAAYLFAITRFAYNDYPSVRRAAQPILEFGELQLETDWLWLYRLNESQLPELSRRARTMYLKSEWPHSDIAGLPSDSVSHSEQLIRIDFNELDNELGLGGSGGFALANSTQTILEATLPKEMAKQDSLSLDAQFYIPAEAQIHASLSMTFIDSTGQDISTVNQGARSGFQRMHRYWVQLHYSYAIPEGTAAIRVATQPNPHQTAANAVIDEINISSPGVRYTYEVTAQGPRLIDGMLWEDL